MQSNSRTNGVITPHFGNRGQTSTKVITCALLLGAMALLCITLLFYRPKTGQAILRSDKATYTLEVAETDEARTHGLSGRKELVANTGMLFVFSSPDAACMWMKKMQFSIDIVWLDESKNIVEIAQNVSPETFPKLFCSVKPATYVLELPAGTVMRETLYIGQKIDISR